jgi:hypothetical protein
MRPIVRGPNVRLDRCGSGPQKGRAGTSRSGVIPAHWPGGPLAMGQHDDKTHHEATDPTDDPSNSLESCEDAKASWHAALLAHPAKLHLDHAARA